ncbi:MAG: DUF1501 domain-containing protein [Planctomycetes bacterium]|nr:DUF1501 domain-containing protein [Planctomycetota bacterium]
MLSILGHPQRQADGWTRREMLQAAGAGLMGLLLPKTLQAEQTPRRKGARAKSVIFMFLFGGPSQLETFDMKPNAIAEIRGPFVPTPCRTPGLAICEHLPRLAQVSDKYTVVRTMTHSYNDHSGAGHYLQTGKRWHIPIGGGFNATSRDWPAIGSVVEYLGQRRQLPGEARTGNLSAHYAVVPSRLGHLEAQGQYIRPGEYAGWLGQTYNPLTTRAMNKRDGNDNPFWRFCSDDELDFQIEGLAFPPELRLDRVNARQSLLHQFETQRAGMFENQRTRDHDRFQQRAVALATSDATRRALDIRQEPTRLRDFYGRGLFGQATLMARRLIAAGVRFVTIHYDCCDGYSWDSHVHSNDVRNHLLPTFDQALAALLVDLDDRGLLDETLVVALGEMGRTPRGTPQWGRNHWSTLFPAVLAGGGIRRGTVFGASDRDAAYPIDRPVSPEDLAATIYHALGIDPHLQLPDATGRPTTIVEGGSPVVDLFG